MIKAMYVLTLACVILVGCLMVRTFVVQDEFLWYTMVMV